MLHGITTHAAAAYTACFLQRRESWAGSNKCGCSTSTQGRDPLTVRLDGAPAPDIKPYAPTFDARETERIGWFASRIERVQTTRSDKRFTEG